MAALHIVLELFATIRIGNDLKITFSTLPFAAAGIFLGPAAGLLTGFAGTFLSQLLTYGITVTTPFWVLPGMMQGLCAGLFFKLFKNKNSLTSYAVTCTASGMVLVIFNLIASYFDGVVIYKYWTLPVLAALIPWRLCVWAVLSIVYTLVLFPLRKVLAKIAKPPA